MNESELFVAGAGPAGLACAILAASSGMSVRVAEANAPPIDKACGEGLMPNAHETFAPLGIEPAQWNSPPFRGIRFIGTHHRAEALFPSEWGIGIRRSLLSEILISRAERVGVRFHWGAAVRDILRTPEGSNIETPQGVFRARWVVGADGQNSVVRRMSQLDSRIVRSRRIGIRRHFHVEPWSDVVEVYWGSRSQAYVTPTAGEEICVAIMASGRLGEFYSELREFPELAARLDSAVAIDAPRGAASLDCRVQTITSKNIALVGDASGSVDALTGEGVSLAFRQAGALLRSLQAGDLDLYKAEHARICAVPRLMSSLLLVMAQYPRVQQRVLCALSRSSGLFTAMLGLHVSDRMPRVLGQGGFVDLAAKLILSTITNSSAHVRDEALR